MKELEILETSRFLDPNSEMIALASFDNTKNIILTAFEIKGTFDESLLRPSVIGALEGFPQLRSCLKDIRKNGRHYLCWYPRPDLEFPVSISDLKHFEASKSILDAVINHLAPRLDRNWDLFDEPPGEIHLLRVAHDHYIEVAIAHHAAFDAATASEFGRQCLLRYRELMTGVKDDFPGRITHGLSTSRKRIVKVKRRKWDDVIHSARLAIKPMFSRPTLPTGTGMPRDKKQYHIKRVLSAEGTAHLNMSVKKRGGTLIDILVASSNLAIERWNTLRNVKTGKVTTAVTMNIRGRYVSLNNSNNVSALFFESNSNDRKDPKKLLRSLSTDRIRQFRKQMDLKHYKNVARMISCASLFPFKIRRKTIHHLTQKHQCSMAITLLGVIWPEMKNGKPTLDSYPTSIGNTQITEVYGTGYKHLTSTPLVLIVYSFLNKLNFILAASGSLFIRKEAEDFMDLFMLTLQEDI
jgi:hypothetical protein